MKYEQNVQRQNPDVPSGLPLLAMRPSCSSLSLSLPSLLTGKIDDWGFPSGQKQHLRPEEVNDFLRVGSKRKKGLVQRLPIRWVTPRPKLILFWHPESKGLLCSRPVARAGRWGSPTRALVASQAVRPLSTCVRAPHPGGEKEGVQVGSDSQPAPTSQEAAHYPASLKSN